MIEKFVDHKMRKKIWKTYKISEETKQLETILKWKYSVLLSHVLYKSYRRVLLRLTCTTNNNCNKIVFVFTLNVQNRLIQKTFWFLDWHVIYLFLVFFTKLKKNNIVGTLPIFSDEFFLYARSWKILNSSSRTVEIFEINNFYLV